jgi:hypothetical protein
MAYAKPVASFADIEDGFIERVHAVVWCTAATVDTRNRPRSRVWHPIWEGKTGRIATNRNALKTKHLARNPYLSLSYLGYRDVWNPVYVDCRAEWDDTRRRANAWRGRCMCVRRNRSATTRPGSGAL